MVIATVILSSGAVLGGAAVALAWMGWAFVTGQKTVVATKRPRPQRKPKIVRS